MQEKEGAINLITAAGEIQHSSLSYTVFFITQPPNRGADCFKGKLLLLYHNFMCSPLFSQQQLQKQQTTKTTTNIYNQEGKHHPNI